MSREPAHKHADRWFWAMLALWAIVPAVGLVTFLVVELSTQPISSRRLNDSIELLITFGVVSLIPFLIHALTARTLIRRRPRHAVQSLFEVCVGTVGILVPWLVFWSLAGAVAISVYRGANKDEYIVWALLIAVFASFLTSIVSTVAGYVVGHIAGLVWAETKQQTSG